jgi:uncharacterized membrane protein
MIRCRACGYLMKAGDLRDKCPACGAPKTSFEPYTDPMANNRRKILNLQLHPVAVHFPVTFAVAALVFSIAIPFFSGDARKVMLDTTKVLVLFMPLLVAAAFTVGWIDGKIRFRKIRNSEILKKKILYACLLFVLSLGLTFVVWIGEFSSVVASSGAILLSSILFVLVFILGLLGTSVTEAAFPGK